MNLSKDNWPIYSDELNKVLSGIDFNKVEKFVDAINSCIANSSTSWIFGNGGSAATASHFCVDLMKGAAIRLGKNIRAVPLMDLVPIQSAWSNDLSYEQAMAMSLKNCAQDGDLVIVITGSGNSKNIIEVAKMGHAMNLKVIGMTGFDGGKVSDLLDVEVHVNSNDMQIVEDVHHSICHFVSKVVS